MGAGLLALAPLLSLNQLFKEWLPCGAPSVVLADLYPQSCYPIGGVTVTSSNSSPEVTES